MRIIYNEQKDEYKTKDSIKKYLIIYKEGFIFCDDFKSASCYFNSVYRDYFISNPKEKRYYTNYYLSKINNKFEDKYKKDISKEKSKMIKIYKIKDIVNDDEGTFILYSR